MNKIEVIYTNRVKIYTSIINNNGHASQLICVTVPNKDNFRIQIIALPSFYLALCYIYSISIPDNILGYKQLYRMMLAPQRVVPFTVGHYQFLVSQRCSFLTHMCQGSQIASIFGLQWTTLQLRVWLTHSPLFHDMSRSLVATRHFRRMVSIWLTSTSGRRMLGCRQVKSEALS